jgi:hypothetical protein
VDCGSEWEARSAYSAAVLSSNRLQAGLDLGIEEDRTEGQRVRICSLARAIADCFRFRNKIGLDVALEALTDAQQTTQAR